MSNKPSLPEGWRCHVSRSFPGWVYCYNMFTGAKTWNLEDIIPAKIKDIEALKARLNKVEERVMMLDKPVVQEIASREEDVQDIRYVDLEEYEEVPNYVQSEGNAKFKVNFKPQEIAPHHLSVKFNNEPVPNSPFECRIIDSQQLVVSGTGVKMCPVGHPAAIVITYSAGNCEDCVVKVHSPGGEVLPLSVRGTGLPLSVTTSTKKKLDAEYLPVVVGAHHVHVVLDGRPVLGSPFTCNVYDVGRVIVSGIYGTHIVGIPVTFAVDASQAGEGNLELVVTTGKFSVRAEVAARKGGMYEVTFVPQEAIPHLVNITFNDEGIPHNPFQCFITPAPVVEAAVARSATLARGDGLNQAVLNTKAMFDIDTMGADNSPVVVISDPYSASVSSILTETRPGLYRVEYRPTKLGTHSIEITVGGRAISYSPFKCEVLDPQSVRVTDIGPIEIETEHQHQQAMEEKPCWSRKSGVDIKKYVIREEHCYTCSLCLKNFKARANCNKHIQGAHLNKFWLCNICGLKRKSKQALSVHNSNTHGETPVDFSVEFSILL